MTDTSNEAIERAIQNALHCEWPETTAAILRALRAERDRMSGALGEMVTTFYDAGCHICGGDCASANPPIGGCPVGAIKRARLALKGDDQ